MTAVLRRCALDADRKDWSDHAIILERCLPLVSFRYAPGGLDNHIYYALGFVSASAPARAFGETLLEERLVKVRGYLTAGATK